MKIELLAMDPTSIFLVLTCFFIKDSLWIATLRKKSVYRFIKSSKLNIFRKLIEHFKKFQFLTSPLSNCGDDSSCCCCLHSSSGIPSTPLSQLTSEGSAIQSRRSGTRNTAFSETATSSSWEGKNKFVKCGKLFWNDKDCIGLFERFDGKRMW